MARKAAFRFNTLTRVIRGICRRRACYALAALACIPAMVNAGPTGEEVVAGSAAVSRPDADTTYIHQGTDQAILNWQSFSIGGREYVQFFQPDPVSVALNRVVGGNPSEILGHLSANGLVFLVNPRGVFFGHGAQVDVGALVASVLDIKNEDFLAGRYVFARGADTPEGTSVVNAGTIHAQDGGFVVLAGDKVTNENLIQARLGTVVLASGSKVTLDVGETGLVDFAVDEAAVNSLAGVENTGQIIADGGRVLMTAKLAEGLVATAVNNEGLIRAHSIEEKDGAIYLTAAGGSVSNSGALDAAGEAGRGGGRVVVYSDRDIALASGSRIEADGDGAGSGGNVRVIAERRLDFAEGAVVSAQGGAGGGEGGLVELSGHEDLSIRGAVLLGEGGQLLIDPTLLTIVAGSSSGAASGTVGELFIESQLDAGVNVFLIAGGINSSGGPFTIADAADGTDGQLFMKIGSVATGFGAFLGDPGAGFDCAGVGVCGPGTTFRFNPSTTGDIALADVGIDIGNTVDLAGGVSSGKIDINEVRVRGPGGFSANLFAGGDVTVHGNILVEQTSPAGGSGAFINLQSDNGKVTTFGDVTLLANNSATGSGGQITYFGEDVLVKRVVSGSQTGSGSPVNLQFNVGASLQAVEGLIDGTSVEILGSSSASSISVNAAVKTPKLKFEADTCGECGSVVMNVNVTNQLVDNSQVEFIPGSFGSFGSVMLTTSGGTTFMTGLTANTIDVLVQGGFLDLRGLSFTAGTMDLEAANGFSGQRGDIFLSGAAFSVSGLLDIEAGADLVNGPTRIDAGALFVETGGDLNLTSVSVGSGVIDEPGDLELLDFMATLGIPTPGHDPNLVLIAGGDINVGSLSLSAPFPYVAFVLNGMLNLGGVSLGSGVTNVLAQFSALNALLSIGVEELSAAIEDVNFSNQGHFSQFGGTTIAVGDSFVDLLGAPYEGDIVIGQNGPLNLGDQNFICVTLGACTGLDNIVTSGVTASLSGAAELFEIPVFDEFGEEDFLEDEDKEEEEYGEAGEEGEGEEAELIEQDSGSSKMCS